MNEANPQGVVGIMTDETGRVIATVSDFHRDGYGGCSLVEAQKIRAERSLAFATINALCSPVITRAIGDYEAERLVENLKTKAGFKATFIEIGHEPVGRANAAHPPSLEGGPT